MKKYIDINKVLQDKNPRLYRLLPGFVISYIKKILHEDKLNEDLLILENLNTRQKFRTFLERNGFTVKVVGIENIPKNGHYIFTSNHPLGGLDGIALYDTIVEEFPDSKFLVNDLLMNLPGVEDCFLPLNKLGKNPREYYNKIDSACSSKSQIIIFPAGMVSRKINGIIQDMPWQKACIGFAQKYKRNVIPVHIDGNNSKFFYNLANLRKKIGIRANIEMFFLVNELYTYKNKTITIRFGEPIPYTQFSKEKSPLEWASYIRQKTYKLVR